MLTSSLHAPQRRLQLDALRGLAIILVMLHHYTVRRMPMEGFGVTLFFTLSGFFASASLLRWREKAVHSGASWWKGLRQFYWRRWMRIVPACVVVVSVAALAGVPYGREHYVSLVFFGSNVAMIHANEWFGRFSPLWSLAVLEQIYLVVPAMLLCLHRRLLLPFMLALILCAPFYLFWCHWTLQESFVWFMVPLAWTDNIGAGALLAWCMIHGTTARLLWAVRPLAVLCGVLMVIDEFGWRHSLHAIEISTLGSALAVWFIAGASHGFRGWFGWVLERQWLGHMGRLSYGLFLLHNFTELLIPRVGWLGWILSTDWQAVLLIPATFGLAYLMHRFIEAPIVRFSRKESTPSQQPA